MNGDFLSSWGQAAYTTVGFFWMALWAFAFGYIVSSLIQVLVTQQRMKQAMGDEGLQQVGLATFFGFISSSCSFAALATTKSLFKKGAGFVPSIAFLLASTNLVIELGFIIAICSSFAPGPSLGSRGRRNCLKTHAIVWTAMRTIKRIKTTCPTGTSGCNSTTLGRRSASATAWSGAWCGRT